MRLFVAVNIPGAEKERLETMLDDLRSTVYPVRWVHADSLHITLKFLGEVPEERQAELAAALTRAVTGVPRFDVAIRGFGAFPSRSWSRIFWLGVEAPPSLNELHERVEQELAPLGFPREARAFSPHLTLGRVKDSSRIERDAFERLAPRAEHQAVFRVEAVDLMRSQPGRGGARYELLERAVLEG